ASGNCSSATPLPIREGTIPRLEHASVTPRTVLPERSGTLTESGLPKATVVGGFSCPFWLIAASKRASVASGFAAGCAGERGFDEPEFWANSVWGGDGTS